MMSVELKQFLDENEIIAMCDVDPEDDEELIYICRDCITGEDLDEDSEERLEDKLRTEGDLKEDSVFIDISQFRPVRCHRCGKVILEGYRFAGFHQD